MLEGSTGSGRAQGGRIASCGLAPVFPGLYQPPEPFTEEGESVNDPGDDYNITSRLDHDLSAWSVVRSWQHRWSTSQGVQQDDDNHKSTEGIHMSLTCGSSI